MPKERNGISFEVKATGNGTKAGRVAARVVSVTNNLYRQAPIDLFSFYVLFFHFRPRDDLMGICLLFLSLVMRTFARA